MKLTKKFYYGSAIFISFLIIAFIFLLKFNSYNLNKTATENFNIEQETIPDTGSIQAEIKAGVFENTLSEFQTTQNSSTVSPSTTITTTLQSEGKKENNSTSSTTTTTATTTINPSSCPQTTLGCVPCSAGETYCRYEEGETSGYLGWACQNNNPGNVKYSSYRIGIITSMGGTAPCGSKGGFMVFSTYETGRNSVKAYIGGINSGLHSAYPTCGNCSLLTFFTSYAPNSPESYTQSIVNKMGGGVTQDTLLSWVVANRFDDFINAIQQTEGFFTQ